MKLAACAALIVACGGPTPAAEAPSSEPAPEPATEVAVEREEMPPAEPPVDPAPRFEPAGACASDAECGFDDPCLPVRCGVHPARDVACAEAAPAPGTCVCDVGRCTLRPNADRPAVSSELACDPASARCGLDRARGVCEPGITDALARPSYRGPTCACEGEPRRCHFRWEEGIACVSNDDCWVENRPHPRPIARPRRLRGREFRGCRDGEHVPVCDEGFCSLQGLGC